MVSGTAGLAEGHQPHLLDAAELLASAWSSITPTSIARCFVKAMTLPEDMEAALTAEHGKTRRIGSKAAVAADKGAAGGGAEKGDVDGLVEALNSLSVRVHQAQQGESSVVDKEIVDLLADLDVTPGEPAGGASMRAVQAWAMAEDEAEVAKAMQEDAMDDLAAQLKGMVVDVEDGSEDEQDGGGESTGGGPPYAQLSPYFSQLESAANESGNAGALFHLQKAKMAMIAAHASMPTRQGDMRGYFDKI